MKSFVGCGNPIHFTIEYDVKEDTPFFMGNFYWLNPIVEAFVTQCDELDVQIEKKDNNMFGVEISMGESSRALYYYKTFFILEVMYPIIWV